MEKSINSIQAVGTVEELNFKIEEKEVILKEGTATKKVTCKQITKANWSNPNLTVKVKDSIVGFNFYPTNEKKLDKGQVVDNPRFKALQTIMGYERGTRVKVDGNIANNEYVGQDGEFHSAINLNAFTVTSSVTSDTDYCDGSLSGVIRTIKPEIKGEDETGRKIVEFLYVNNDEIFPINLILDEDLVNDFEDNYSKGDNVVLDIECTTRTVGTKAQTKKFGRESHRVSGYTVTEYKIFGGGDVLEDENKYYLDKESVKKALADRDIKIEQMKNEGKDKKKDKDEVMLDAKEIDDPFA
jgi:hypothetical protein